MATNLEKTLTLAIKNAHLLQSKCYIQVDKEGVAYCYLQVTVEKFELSIQSEESATLTVHVKTFWAGEWKRYQVALVDIMSWAEVQDAISANPIKYVSFHKVV